MWALWSLHVRGRLHERLRERLRGTTPARTSPASALIPGAASSSLTDNEKASK
jgi:hypothetical protein